MSTDLKIELFANDLFNYLWKHHGLKEPPKSKHPPRKSPEFNEKVFRAVQSRQAMFYETYEPLFEDIHGNFFGNSSDFFDAIVEHFPHYVDWSKNPNPEMVMSLFLLSCAFVATLCMWCNTKGDNFLDVGPKAWAMFVDLHLKEQFYGHGGWKKLRKFVDRDAVVLHDYVKTFSQVQDCDMGKAAMFHQAHLTVAAAESFDEFEASWEGVDDANAPPALKWVDYCVHVPFMKIQNVKFYREPEPEVFQKIEDVVLDLGYILDPDREGDYFDSDALETPTASPQAEHRKSQTPRKQSKCRRETTSSFPVAPIGRFDTDGPAQGTGENSFFGSDEEDLTATNPDNILKMQKTYQDTVDVDRLARIYSMIPKKKAVRNPEIDGSVTEREKPGKSSGVVDPETCGALESSPEEIIGLNAKMTPKNLSQIDCNSHIQSRTSHKSEYPIQQIPTSLSDNKMDLDKSLEDPEVGCLPIGFVMTPNDNIDPQSKNNSTNIKDIDAIMGQLGLEKFSEYAPLDSKRRVDVYLKTVDLDNIAVLGDIQEDTPVKSPSTNVSVLSAPRKSPLTSPNVNVLSTPRKSPLTSPNVNASSTPRKSSLNSPNENSLSNPDDYLFKKINTSGSSDLNRKSPAGKENSPSSISKAEIKKQSPHQKNVQVHSISPNSKKEADAKKLRRIKDKCPVKGSLCLYLDVDDPSKDEKKSLFHLPTPPPLKTDTCVKKDNTNNLKSFLNFPSYDPMWSGLDGRHRNSVLNVDDVENDSILENSLTLLEPASKNDPSRPSKEREYGPGNRRISQDSSSAAIYQLTHGQNSSADATVENQFKLAPGVGVEEKTKNNEAEITLDCGKPLKTKNEMTTDQSPFGFDDGEKANKSKQEVNSNDPNLEALQTGQSESTTAESKPQDLEKKGKKKKKKRITRLDQRIKEEGNGVLDVTRLIFVMGHLPGMASVASAFRDSKKQITKDDNKEK